MKVLQINSVCGIRSTGRICGDIAEVLETQGHTCKIAYGRETVPEKYQDYAVRIGNNMSVKADALASRLLDNAGFNSARSTKKFLDWVKEYDPDVIHLHNIHGYYLHAGLLFAYLKEANKPVIWTFHDCWPFTGHCAYFSFAGCEQWKNECVHCSRKRSYPKSLTDRCQRNFRKKKEFFCGVKDMTIVTPSQWLAGLVKESFLQEYPVKVIPNGIDLEAFQPTEGDFRTRHQLENKKIVLGVASVWGKRKGLDDFIQLSSMLDATYQVVLVGISETQKQALPENIIGIVRTNSTEELAQLYTTADIFVNSTYEDNYPTVNLEAQACGTPVITYATGGSVESVPEENVVAQGDVQGLYRKIIAADAKLKEELLLDKKDMLASYLELYKD